ncbi:helix-turn-helix domain-containing protein [[Ruminococcus] torques]|uniref:helix-turn-helix domain-containing protein n=1 Tax=[Ruminococcus] torques TaxID=33039 RepID=UPI00210A3898|nr:helix-turn-helix domain-containing protein [[Ruminococcus] torques]MCQ5367648.1 helix-turn-helix domain-containing protein [[Ruminococcus] torques]
MGAEKSKKGSHLTKEERRIIAVLHEEGRSPYEIGKLTGRASNTIRNELKRGTTTIILGYYEKEKYFPDTGQAIYEKNRKRCRKYMVNKFRNFLTYIEEQLALIM